MADLIPNPAIQTIPQNTNNNDLRTRPGEILPQSGDGRVTTLSDLTQIIGNQNLSEEMTDQNLADQILLPKQNAFTPKDPAITAKLLQALLSTDMSRSLAETGETELVNKLAEFADEVMLSPDALPADLTLQQGKTTMFSGDLWKIMKDVFSGKVTPKPETQTQKELFNNNSGNKASVKLADAIKAPAMTLEQMKRIVTSRDAAEAFPKSEIYKNAALDFLKAAVGVSSKEDIINSIAANLKFLAAEAAPSMAVREQLGEAADNLNLQTFPALKGQIMELLNTTGKSLLLNNKTKALIPLAVYNMSRLSFEASDLTESFSELVKLSDPETASDLKLAFIKYIENSDLPSEDKVAVLERSEIASAKHSMTLIAERLSDSAAVTISRTPASELADTLTKILDLFRDNADNANNGVKPDTINNTTNTSNNANTNTNTNNNANNTAQTKITADQKSVTNTTATAASTANNNPPMSLAKAVSTIKDMVNTFTPDNMKGALNTVVRDFEKTKNLNEFAGRLSMIVNKIVEPDKKMVIAQALNEVLGSMAANKDVNYTPPTATETLADFVAKNLNDPALKTLSELGPGEMVRSLLAAPGSNTPLVHMMAPLHLGDLRAFGEIWVDPNAEWVDPDGKKDGKAHDNAQVSHVFLAFSVENTGYFEMELYAREKDLNISISCPRGMEERFARLTEIIPRLVQSQGYTAKGMMVSSIFKPRELSAVFPKITREISELNVKC
ncbi:MAG: hypothetical protein LBM41_01835 [Ruminococcus sp.]|nr:hypothetical protein [Ruminococcus sp.]